MSDGGPLIDLGDIGKLARPVTVFIEKISAGLGNIYKPIGQRREARAEADAKLILARADIEVTDLERRALQRRLAEDARDQEAIEEITRLALPLIREDAKPGGMDLDWIAQFYDRARMTSSEEMRGVWAKILSGEANAPGSYSRRTVQLVSTFSKDDAHTFSNGCEFVWRWPNGMPFIAIYDVETLPDAFTFLHLTHLEALGLIKFDPGAGFWGEIPDAAPIMEYHGRKCRVTNRNPPRFNIGRAMLTQAGKELLPIADAVGDQVVWEYTRAQWRKLGYAVEDLANAP